MRSGAPTSFPADKNMIGRCLRDAALCIATTNKSNFHRNTMQSRPPGLAVTADSIPSPPFSISNMLLLVHKQLRPDFSVINHRPQTKREIIIKIYLGAYAPLSLKAYVCGLGGGVENRTRVKNDNSDKSTSQVF